MARDNLANFTQAEAISDSKGLPTTSFLQRINAILSGLRSLGGDFDGVLSQPFYSPWFIEFPDDKTYTIMQKAAFAFSITDVTTKTSSGTCTVTVKINGVALGGTANSASTSEQTQSHTSDNLVAIDDTVTIVVSSNSSAEDLSVDIVGATNLAA